MFLKIAFLTPEKGWMIQSVRLFADELKCAHDVTIYHDHKGMSSYDICFMLSYPKIVTKEYLDKNKHNIVVHASALPEGKGWSPWVWQILEGKNVIPISLFEAVEGVDAGDIYIRDSITLSGLELLDEIRVELAKKTLGMCKAFLSSCEKGALNPEVQQGSETFYSRRSPKDSELNAEKSLLEQFNLLRVVDNENYPAYFIKDGKKYVLKIYQEEQHETL